MENSGVQPRESIEITPPQGVVLYDEDKHHFGLNKLLEGEVLDYREPDRYLNYVDGTILRFEPGTMICKVSRRDLTADEINKTGELLIAIYNSSILDRLLSLVLADARSTSNQLNQFVGSTPGIDWRRPDRDINDELGRKTSLLIQQVTGIDQVILAAKQTALTEELSRLNGEAYALRITVFEQAGSRWGHVVSPPEKTTKHHTSEV